MNKLPYIVTATVIALAGLFAILNRFWSGFVYFVLVSLLLLSLFWTGWLIYLYFSDFQEELKERFNYFKSKTINETKITTDYFEENIAIFKKQFNKKTLKDKILKWFQILIAFSIAITFLIGMIFV